MKDVHASLRHLRIAPRKVRLVVDAVRGMNARIAERDLQFNSKHAALPVLKLLRSAIANAKHNFHLDPEKLYIKHIVANEGPTLKRYRPRAFGSAAVIRKRTSHVMLVLGTTEKGKVEAKKEAEKTKQTEEIKKQKADMLAKRGSVQTTKHSTSTKAAVKNKPAKNKPATEAKE
jgi:large subunit ribosomal protein L22